MKYISRILFTVGLVFGLTACTEDGLETAIPELPTKGDMSVNITFAMPDAGAQTRSKVSGTEERVHTMQMVCFDARGLYLGIRNAEITPDKTVDKGTIKGTVPQGTSRIHFIANRNLSIPLNASVGTPEDEVMASEELSTLWNENTIDTNGDGKPDHQEVCYWGYHKEANAAAMNLWLNPEGAPGEVEDSKVYLIRDRAKIVFTYDPTGANEDITVTEIRWLIHNGRERGYLAPAKTYWENEAYYTNSSAQGHTSEKISAAGMNEYTKCGRYSLWRSAKDNDDGIFDLAYQSTGTYESLPQFLFDDGNKEIDDLKAILKVTYNVEGSSQTVYHVLKLNDNDKNLYEVVRNRTYYINAKLLKPNVAYYETLKDAIDGTEFVNADVEVDREIPDINDETHTLQIKLPTETTSIVLNSVGEHNDMHFVYRKIDLSEDTTNPADFNVYWEDEQTFCSDPTVAYNSKTKQFEITVTVNNLSQQLQDEWIVVENKDTGLKRYIHVYVIDQFRFKTYPTLKASGSSYVLSFQLPPTEAPKDDPAAAIYPAGLYPIDVKFATSTLKAYGLTQDDSDYGLFGVTVESTRNLTQIANFESNYNDPISTTADSSNTKWYYQQPDGKWWDFWYTYSIKNYEQTVAEDGTTGGGGYVNIYLEDVTDRIKYATVNEVGLFMQIDYFGKIYSIPVTQ